MGDADRLSREQELQEIKKMEKGKVIRKNREEKHRICIDNENFCRHDSGKICKIVREEDREDLIFNIHEKIGHQSAEYVYVHVK